jgi:uncharacterized membrane protein
MAIAAFVVGTLCLAGAVHISTILLVPEVAEADGWSRLAAVAGERKFAEIRDGGSGAGAVPGLDPMFLNGACSIDLSENPAAISLEARGLFWSLALYDPQGTITFSLNDRTATEGRMRMLVVDAAQNAELEQSLRPEDDQTIVVEAESDRLIALLRLFAPTPSARRGAASILEQAGCAPASIEAESPASGG